MKTIVLVLAWNGERFLRPCLDALMRLERSDDIGIVVVDNASTDDSATIVRSYPDVALIESDRNRGFSGGNNLGLRAIREGHLHATFSWQPDVVVLLNQDTEVAPDWIVEIERAFGRHATAGIVGCKAVDPDGTTLQHAGGTLLWPVGTGTHRGAGEPDEGQYDEDVSAEFVTGAAFAIRRELLDTVGLLDEGFTPAYYEDVDYCFRARAAGYDVVYAPAARLVHHEGTSLGLRSAQHQRIYHRNRVRFLLKWRTLEQLDAWLPAEHADIVRWSTADSLARKQAYIYGLLALPDLVRERHDDGSNAYAHLVTLLNELHSATVREESRVRAEQYVTAQA